METCSRSRGNTVHHCAEYAQRLAAARVIHPVARARIDSKLAQSVAARLVSPKLPSESRAMRALMLTAACRSSTSWSAKQRSRGLELQKIVIRLAGLPCLDESFAHSFSAVWLSREMRIVVFFHLLTSVEIRRRESLGPMSPRP
jgi:hypothetical protein